MEKIKISFNENGQSLEKLLIQIIKVKLNSARLDFEKNDILQYKHIDK